MPPASNATAYIPQKGKWFSLTGTCSLKQSVLSVGRGLGKPTDPYHLNPVLAGVATENDQTCFTSHL